MSSNPGFVHLRLHSEYSIMDSLIRVKPLVSRVVELDMPAVAITDQLNFYALIKFYSAANSKGIKPICGCDLLVAEDDNPDQQSLLVLLVRNQQGYRNLVELISLAYLQGQVGAGWATLFRSTTRPARVLPKTVKIRMLHAAGWRRE